MFDQRQISVSEIVKLASAFLWSFFPASEVSWDYMEQSKAKPKDCNLNKSQSVFTMWPLSFMDDELQWHSGIIFHSNHGTDCFLETKTLFNWNLSNECVIDFDNSKNGWSEYFCYKDHQYSFNTVYHK